MLFRSMQYGMLLAAISFFVSAYLEYQIQKQQQIHDGDNDEPTISVAWQIPQITILTVAEIFLSVTGLEFAYSQAPATMQTLILALYLFTTTIGDAFGAVLYATVFADMDVVTAMVICAICLLVNLAMFSCIAGKWKPYERSSSSPGSPAGFELLSRRTQEGAADVDGDDAQIV